MGVLDGKGRGCVRRRAPGSVKAIATAFIEAGAGVVLCDLNAGALDAAARGLDGHAVGGVTERVGREPGRRRDARGTRLRFGSLDIVVNCAGFGVIIAPLTEVTAEKWRSVQAVTRCGVFFGVTQGARHMLEQDARGVDHQHLRR